MNFETFCFILKKNFGGYFEMFDAGCIYYPVKSNSYIFDYEPLLNRVNCGSKSFYLNPTVATEEDIIDFFISVSDYELVKEFLTNEH